jgi:thymidine kinase
MDTQPSYFSNEGYLELIIGPMFSGKTTSLYKIYNECKVSNVPVLVINHSFDDRYDTNNSLVYTHDKLNMPCITTQTLGNILVDSKWSNIDFESIRVVLINEGQFFEDLVPFVEKLLQNNKQVYVCGLDSDFERKKFGTILDLIPLSDTVKKLKSVCSLCNNGTPGIFSKRVTKEKDTVLIGVDNYIPVCRKCYSL